MSLRQGGVSAPPWDSLNLSYSVGDDARAVAENRRRFAAALGARPVWLKLEHGVTVLRLTRELPDVPGLAADAAWTDEPSLACTVGAADCLPVLLAVRDGRAVAAAHAGWRGLAAGVIEATVQALARGAGAAPAELQVWLGPCIGPRRFEVGADVLQAFAPAPGSAEAACFVPRESTQTHVDGRARWLADLQQLARLRLQAAGVQSISAERACTHEDAARFFSYRRSGVTGRMAAAIWRR